MSAIFPNLEFLIAAILPSDGSAREQVVYELRRLAQFDDPRVFWGSLAAIVFLFVIYVLFVYRKEYSPLPWLFRGLLPCLRIIAVAGAVLYFLGLEKRVDQKVVNESEVLVLVDTSQSMLVEDEVNGADSKKVSRAGAVKSTLADSSLIENLRQDHEVALIGFDQKLSRISAWSRSSDGETKANDSATAMPTDSSPVEITAWQQELQPNGTETRIGDALKEVLQPTNSRPLAGIVLISDGGQNLGIDPLSLINASKERNIPSTYRWSRVSVASTKFTCGRTQCTFATFSQRSCNSTGLSSRRRLCWSYCRCRDLVGYGRFCGRSNKPV